YFRNEGSSACICIQHFNKLHDTAFAVEALTVAASIFIFLTKVIQCDANAAIKKSKFTETTLENVPVVSGGDEDCIIGPEMYGSTCGLTGADLTYGVLRNACAIFLFEYFSVAVYSYVKVFAKRVHTT